MYSFCTTAPFTDTRPSSIIAAAPRIARAVAPGPGAALVLSGILGEQYPRVRAAYEAFGFREEASLAIGEWTSGLLRRA